MRTITEDLIEIAKLESDDINRVKFGTISFIVVGSRIIRDKIERTKNRDELEN